MHERQKGAARRKSETAAIGPRRLAEQAERQRDREAERQRRRL